MCGLFCLWVVWCVGFLVFRFCAVRLFGVLLCGVRVMLCADCVVCGLCSVDLCDV